MMEVTLPNRFLTSYWQKRSKLVPGLVSELAATADWVREFKRWCRPPAAARLFVLQDDIAIGAARCALVPDPRTAYRHFQVYAAENEMLTLLLNRVEAISPEVRRLREGLKIGREWRYDDVVATLSTRGSGIGFHAGHEDGFIVQLTGKRRWLVWKPENLSEDYRLYLLGHPGKTTTAVPSRPSRVPDYEYTLEAGDVLYLPALFGHEGRTIDLSVSLSIGWRGLNVWRLVVDAIGPVSFDHGCSVVRGLLFDLIDDPPDDTGVSEYFKDAVQRGFSVLELTEGQMKRIQEHTSQRFPNRP